MLVKPKKWDMISKETIKLVHAWFTGRSMIKYYKRRNPRKKVIGVIFPISELIVAQDGIPFLPIRNEIYDYNAVNKVLEGITRITKLFGWNSMDRLIKMAFFTRTGADVIEYFIDNLIEAFKKKMEMVIRVAENDAFPVDSCFASRSIYGFFRHNYRFLDGALDYSYRCGYLYKLNDLLGTFIDQNIFLDIPPKKGESAERFMEKNLIEITKKIESITGTPFSEQRLSEAILITNKIKNMFKEFLYQTCNEDVIPYRPLTFAYIQYLMTFSLIDFNSNLKAYYKNISNLMHEFKERVDKGLGFNVARMPKILYVPIISGIEFENLQFIIELGGTVVFPDLEIMGFLEPIPNSNNVLRSYARYLLNMNDFLGPDNQTYARSIIQFAKDLRCDGIVFQDTFACKNIGVALKVFKDLARQEGFPVLELSFNNYGENIEQNRTRIEAFMEMLKD
ncbi:MAG: 2-hydroxyacyl-CoA dehydratase family protein [Promethearchaeota archaeon]